MATEIYSYKEEYSSKFIHRLQSHLPYSLPLLRRLQFCSFPGGKTPNSRLLSSYSPDALNSSSTEARCFVFAYLDFSRGPETEMWLFSSLELFQGQADTREVLTSEEEALCREQVLALFGKLKEIEAEYIKSDIGIERGRQAIGVVNCGSLHEYLVDIIEEKGLVVRKTVNTLKYISEVKNIATVTGLPENLKWRTVRVEDIEYILSRTSIPRKLRTMRLLPSAAVVDKKTDSLAAWAFLGADGSLTHLYVEEAFRKQGLAKAISLKLYHEAIPRYGSDGFTHADVEIQNESSRRVAQNLGGEHRWTVHWTWVRFSGI